MKLNKEKVNCRNFEAYFSRFGKIVTNLRKFEARNI